MLDFNNALHGLAIKVQQVGSMVQIKPFSGYHAWQDWFDVEPLDNSAAVDAAQSAADAAQSTANTGVTNAAAAQSTANTAVTNAATAQSAANAAQTTANTGVTNAAAAQSTANTALANAGTAQTTANNAGTDANDASSTGGLFFPQQMRNVIGTAPAPTFNNLQIMSSYVTLSGDTSEIAFDVRLKAGWYRPSMMAVKYSSAGKISLYRNTTLLGSSVDLYKATNEYNYFFEWAQFSAAAGIHTFRLKIEGHNASSSGYLASITYLAMRATDASGY